MRIVLLNENPAVSRLIGISLSKLGYEFDESSLINEDQEYDIVIFDSSVYEQNLENTFDDKSTIYLIPRDFSEFQDKPYKLEKPFLPMDFLDVFDRVKSQISEKNSEILTQIEPENSFVNEVEEENLDAFKIRNLDDDFEDLDSGFSQISDELEPKDDENKDDENLDFVDEVLPENAEQNQYTELSDMLKEIDDMQDEKENLGDELNLDENLEQKAFEIIDNNEESDEADEVEDETTLSDEIIASDENFANDKNSENDEIYDDENEKNYCKRAEVLDDIAKDFDVDQMMFDLEGAQEALESLDSSYDKLIATTKEAFDKNPSMKSFKIPFFEGEPKIEYYDNSNLDDLVTREIKDAVNEKVWDLGDVEVDQNEIERKIKIALDEEVAPKVDDEKNDENLAKDKSKFDSQNLKNELENAIAVSVENSLNNSQIKEILKDMKIKINISFEEK